MILEYLIIKICQVFIILYIQLVYLFFFLIYMGYELRNVMQVYCYFDYVDKMYSDYIVVIIINYIVFGQYWYLLINRNIDF